MKYAPILLFLFAAAAGCQGDFDPDDVFVAAGATAETPASGAPVGQATGTILPTPDLVVSETFLPVVQHAYFPLEPGTFRIYEGDKEGLPRRDEIRVLHGYRVILDVECTQAFQQVYLDGELVEVTTEWFAQDQQGNVWKFGEASFALEEGLFVLDDDSWLAGEEGALPWLFLAADPQVGDVYVEIRPDGQDTVVVLSVSESESVPVGQFDNCLQVLENPDDPDDQDLIIYGPGVGMLSEEHDDGRIELTAFGRE